ncbi:polysaccharide deacetylase family protein [Pseudodesulfovibrio sp.]|uniref:polysaccharide deacetylase family protein n=1 Tax=unclassified Pseudodesulfovibrio TaxID=2661612 RepID=UPI003AFF9D83
MIVKNIISPCWLAPEADLDRAADRAAEILSASPVPVFFRADDLGVPGDKCRRMLDLFRTRGVPLHLAVTPAWLTPARWNVLREWAGEDDLWCWHQHGWRHLNHQTSGKKGEFGTERNDAELRADLTHGRDRLAEILGDAFRPVFTPPWNRFDPRVGPILKDLGFKAVSRSSGEDKKVPLPLGLPDLPINVDLHTRREEDPAEGLEHLIIEFKNAVAEGRVGLMLHHQRMNDAAFAFLDRCLEAVAGPDGPELIRLDRL